MPCWAMSEEDHLAMSNRHIAEAVRRIAEQEERLRVAKAAGSVPKEGERLLANLRTTLHEMRVHHGLILDAIEKAKAGG